MLRAMDLPLSADKPLELLMLERTKALQTAEVKTPDVSSGTHQQQSIINKSRGILI